ncbi:MAG: argS [Chlamydiia bacterium]|nr:argS [Chlamydiia bacterium]
MSESVVQLLRNEFSKVCQKLFPDLSNPVIEVMRSTQDTFGHYQCNSAMKLAAQLKQNPRKIAEELAKSVQSEAIQKVEIAGPGFINIWLTPEFLAKRVQDELQDPCLLACAKKQERVIVDFSSPNVAKELHVGHLRSTIIGDCLARIFEFLGHDVLRLNHIGDFGTSFGMLIAYMKENCRDAIQNVDNVSLTDLVTFYKQSKACFDNDPEFKKRAQQEVVALQSGDADAALIWKAICEISRRAYQEIYTLLDVSLIERGESFYNNLLAQVVTDCEKKGLVTISDGAKCIFLDGYVNREGEPLPYMIQKSDGGYNYDTTDLAALFQRVEDEKADRIIYVIDAGQTTHMEMLFKAAEKAKYLDRAKVRVDHVPFGLVLGDDGKKFRTRSGETEKLIDLLNTAINKAEEVLKERNPDWSAEERKKVAHALGIGAVKYADLSCNRTSDYAFSYDKMLKFEGNTIAFLMYSYVRAKSIQRKTGVDPSAIMKTTQIILTQPAEIALALHLTRFSEMIEQIVQDLLPNRLTDYLYELAEKFNAFFRDCRVEGAPEQNSRVLLTEAVIRTFEKGFILLGVRPVERM